MEKREMLIDYQNILLEIKTLEKNIEESLFFLIQKQDIKQYRARDFGERGIYLDVRFDMLNLRFFEEDNIKKIKEFIISLNDLKEKQKNIENKIDILKKNEKEIKRNINGY